MSRCSYRVIICFCLTMALGSMARATPHRDCQRSLSDQTATPVGPDAPPAPQPTIPSPAPPVRPAPDHPPERRPIRREVPIPLPSAPDDPGRQIPAKPLEDPKDINPEDLYSTDRNVGPIWNELPIGLRRLMIEGMQEERSRLEAHVREKYGSADATTLMQVTMVLQTEIERLEKDHQEEILSVVRKMMENRYGETLERLTIRMGTDLPRVQNPEADSDTLVPELPQSLDEGMVYRTELRNLWLQGEGWIGMKEFIFHFGPELDEIVPGLAKKYQELDRLYRLGQLAQLDLIPMPEMIDLLPKEAISAGREIVTTQYEVLDQVDGTQTARVKEVRGVAVGRNAWAAAHEARKAASQMVTPAEGVYRWLMPSERRERLNEATNSARAEIRQGVFGPAMVVALKKRLSLIQWQELSRTAGQSFATEENYYEVMDGLFSLPPQLFEQAMRLIFDSRFEENRDHQQMARAFLEEHGVMREF